MATSTRNALLREAEKLIRTRGYADFSYADLSAIVGIRKASIHHHFPTKEALGVALIDGYLAEFHERLRAIEALDSNAADKLRSYAAFFGEALANDQLPLCGALAAEAQAMPVSMKDRTKAFFETHIRWLAKVIGQGVESGEFRSDLDVHQSAHHVLSVLEGGSLVAWATSDGSSLMHGFEAALNGMMPAQPVRGPKAG